LSKDLTPTNSPLLPGKATVVREEKKKTHLYFVGGSKSGSKFSHFIVVERVKWGPPKGKTERNSCIRMVLISGVSYQALPPEQHMDI
jgi:hypothetical protein